MPSNFTKFNEILLKIENNYKNNESNKIIQIFHITVLIILGFYNLKLDKNSYEALYLLIALSCIAGAYLFWYLADIVHFNIQVLNQKIIHEQPDNKVFSNIIKNQLKPLYQKGFLMQGFCFFSAVFSHIFIFLSTLHYFKLTNNHWPYIVIFLIFSVGVYYYYDINIKNNDISQLDQMIYEDDK